MNKTVPPGYASLKKEDREFLKKVIRCFKESNTLTVSEISVQTGLALEKLLEPCPDIEFSNLMAPFLPLNYLEYILFKYVKEPSITFSEDGGGMRFEAICDRTLFIEDLSNLKKDRSYTLFMLS